MSNNSIKLPIQIQAFPSAYLMPSPCPSSDARSQAYDSGLQEAKNRLASWIMANGFSTGHGETIEDLLAELELNVNELRSKLAKLQQ